jgi:hypothetical protein
MGSYFYRARFAILFLILIAIGRLVLGATGRPYQEGTNVFSIVTFTFFACLFYGAFSRPLWGFRFFQAMILGAVIAFSAQVLIFLATVGSYLLDVQTYFNNPRALNVEEAIPLSRALLIRLGGLVFNPIFASIAALIGWSLGNLIPRDGAK